MNGESPKVLCLTSFGMAGTDLADHETYLCAQVNWSPLARLTKPLSLFANVKTIDFGPLYADLGCSKCQEKILDEAKEFKPDIVIWTTMNYEIPPSTLQQLRSLGAVCGGWFFDDEVRFDEYSRYFAQNLDFVLTCDRFSVEKYRELGITAFFFPVTASPQTFKNNNLERITDASFIGRRFGDRGEFIEHLIEQGIKVEAYGKGWDNGFVSMEDMIRIYNESQISLCFTKSYGENTRPQLKDKIFDITACGSMLLCEYLPGLEDFFELDKEIVCFKNDAELKEKLLYYLQHPELAQSIAEAGMKKTLESYSSEKFFEKLLQDLRNLKPQNSARTPQIWSHHAKALAVNAHIRWAEVLFKENRPTARWRDELETALTYMPDHPLCLTLLKEGQNMEQAELELLLSSEQHRKILNLKSKLSHLFEEMKKHGVEEYALYGGGKHTSTLLSFGLLPQAPSAIVDDSPKVNDLNGVPVVTADQLGQFPNINAVIVSSDGWEEGLSEKLQSWIPEHYSGWRIYNAQQQICAAKGVEV